MMTIGQLISKLEKLVKEDEYRKGMIVTFGDNVTPIKGGIIRKDQNGLTILNLAPIKLDQVGGF